MPRGRKEKLDYETIKHQIYELGKLDLQLKEIAVIFGVTPETISRYMKRYPKLRQAHNEGKADLIRRLKKTGCEKAIEDKDTSMIKYYLNNLTEYSEKPLVDQSQHTHHATIIQKLHSELKEREGYDRKSTIRVA